MPALSHDARFPALLTNASRTNLRLAALVGVGVALALGILLTARRAAGQLTAFLPSAQLVVVVVVLAALIFASRAAWLVAGPPNANRAERWLDYFIGWGGTAAILLVLIGCSYPSTRFSHWLLWTPLVIADQVLLRAFFVARRPTLELTPSPTPKLELTITDGEADNDEQIVQRLTRLRGADGVELIRGTLRADFVAGQRHATLHVAFCPPLARLPEITAEPVDGPDATLKIVQAYAHGARLELRLEEPTDEPCQVQVDFAAAPTASAPRSASASRLNSPAPNLFV